MTDTRKIRCIRLSDDEYRKLQENADSLGVTKSELIRRTAIYGKKMSPVVLDMEPLKKMLFEMQKQGNNLNQLAREANTYGLSPSLALRIESEIERSSESREKLVQLIMDVREGRLNR